MELRTLDYLQLVPDVVQLLMRRLGAGLLGDVAGVQGDPGSRQHAHDAHAEDDGHQWPQVGQWFFSLRGSRSLKNATAAVATKVRTEKTRPLNTRLFTPLA